MAYESISFVDGFFMKLLVIDNLYYYYAGMQMSMTLLMTVLCKNKSY